jgi:hypothetical protein
MDRNTQLIPSVNPVLPDIDVVNHLFEQSRAKGEMMSGTLARRLEDAESMHERWRPEEKSG